MPKTRWLTDAELQAWRGYRRMRVLLDLHINRDLATDSGLSDADYDVLSTLTENSERQWRASELAARMLWSTSRLSHHIARMEARGLVHREEATDDGRGATVTLTKDGLAAIRKAAPDHVASVRRNLIDLLSPSELKALASMSAKVIEHLGE